MTQDQEQTLHALLDEQGIPRTNAGLALTLDGRVRCLGDERDEWECVADERLASIEEKNERIDWLRAARARTASWLRTLREVIGLLEDTVEVWREMEHAATDRLREARVALERAKPFVVLAGAWAMDAGLPFGGATETLALIEAALVREEST